MVTYRVGPRRYVVDTSVVLKWQLDDEDDVPQALALRDACLVSGDVELHAPMMLAYELTNALGPPSGASVSRPNSPRKRSPT